MSKSKFGWKGVERRLDSSVQLEKGNVSLFFEGLQGCYVLLVYDILVF